MSAPCLYTVTGWGVVSCVCGMAFLCGSTLVKVPLLQAGTVVRWPQMFQSNVKPKQTNKQTNKKWTSMGCAFSYWTVNVRVDLLDPDLDSDNFAPCKHSIRGHGERPSNSLQELINVNRHQGIDFYSRSRKGTTIYYIAILSLLHYNHISKIKKLG